MPSGMKLPMLANEDWDLMPIGATFHRTSHGHYFYNSQVHHFHIV